ncbi:hypothetical protein JTE90_022575, partial [Oedothorax gibbosus]
RHRNYQPLVPTQPCICKFCGDVYKHERHLREHESTHVKDDEGFPINDWLERFMKNSSNISECFYHGNLRDVGVGTSLSTFPATDVSDFSD